MIQRQVESRLGKESKELRGYKKKYLKALEIKWRISNKEELVNYAKKSQLIFLADFHGHFQSQKTHLRILKELLDYKVTLGLECLSSDQQKFINQYLDNQLDEEKFLKLTQWQKKWGFPWAHYKVLVNIAKENKFPILALNKKNSNKASLKIRDNYSAHRIVEYVKVNPDQKLIVIYGEYHLAKEHLPREIQKINKRLDRLRPIFVYQNPEEEYFRLLKKYESHMPNVIKSGKNIFSLINVPPWVKWQNYLMFLENKYDIDLSDEENKLELTDYVSKYIRILSEDLGLKIKTENLSVYSANEMSFWWQIEKQLNKTKLQHIQWMVEEELSFYIPELGIAYMARITVNHAASLAMQFIHFQLAKTKSLASDFPNEFTKSIWIDAISYFGSKMINHNIKADTISDILISLKAQKDSQFNREPLMLSLAQKIEEKKGFKSKLTFKPHRKNSYIIASQILGHMLGEKLYHGYSHKLISLKKLKILLMISMESNLFKKEYSKIVTFLDKWPEQVESKTELL